MIGVIYETGDIDLQFDIVFASYYSNIYYGSDGETNVAFEITFDITWTPSNVIWRWKQCQVFR